MRVERRAEEIHSRPTDCGARHVVIRNAKEWQLRPLPERGEEGARVDSHGDRAPGGRAAPRAKGGQR